MAGFGAALRSEIYQMLRSPVVRGMAAVTALATLIPVLYQRFGFLWITAKNIARNTGQLQAPPENAYVPLVEGLSSGLLLGGYLLLTLAAGSLAWDREHGLARLFLIRRASRSALVMAKFSALVFLGVLLVGLVVLLSWGSASLLFDFGPVVEEGYEIYSEAEVLREVLTGIAASAVPLLAVIAFGLLISTATGSTARAVGIALIAILAFDIFKGLLGNSSRWIFASYLPSLGGGSYIKEVTWKVVGGFSDITLTGEDLWYNFAVPAVETVLFVLLALAVAAKRRM